MESPIKETTQDEVKIRSNSQESVELKGARHFKCKNDPYLGRYWTSDCTLKGSKSAGHLSSYELS
jgi:hypothetical protein